MELKSITVVCPITGKEITINNPSLMAVFGDEEGIVISIDKCPDCGECHSELLF